MAEDGDAAETGAPAWKRLLPIGLLAVAAVGVGIFFLLPEGENSASDGPAPEAAAAQSDFVILPIDISRLPSRRRMLEPVADVAPASLAGREPGSASASSAEAELLRPTPERVARREPSNSPAGAFAPALAAEEGAQARAEREGIPVRRVGIQHPDGRVIEGRIVGNDRQAGQLIRRWLAGPTSQRAAPEPIQETGVLYERGPFQELTPFNGSRPLADPSNSPAQALAAALAAEQKEDAQARAEREGVPVRRVGVQRPDGRVIEGRIVRNDRQAGQLIRRWLAGATSQKTAPERGSARAAARIYDEILRASGLAGVRVAGTRVARYRVDGADFGDPIALEYALVQNYSSRLPPVYTGCPGPICELRESRFVPPQIFVRHVVFPQDLTPFRAGVQAGPPGLAPPGLDLRIPERRHVPSSALVQARLRTENFDFSQDAERSRLASLRAVEIGPQQFDISPPLRFDRTSFTFTDIARWRFRSSSALSDVRRFYGPIYGSLNGALHGALLPAEQ